MTTIQTSHRTATAMAIRNTPPDSKSRYTTAALSLIDAAVKLRDRVADLHDEEFDSLIVLAHGVHHGARASKDLVHLVELFIPRDESFKFAIAGLGQYRNCHRAAIKIAREMGNWIYYSDHSSPVIESMFCGRFPKQRKRLYSKFKKVWPSFAAEFLARFPPVPVTEMSERIEMEQRAVEARFNPQSDQTDVREIILKELRSILDAVIDNSDSWSHGGSVEPEDVAQDARDDVRSELRSQWPEIETLIAFADEQRSHAAGVPHVTSTDSASKKIFDDWMPDVLGIRILGEVIQFRKTREDLAYNLQKDPKTIRKRVQALIEHGMLRETSDPPVGLVITRPGRELLKSASPQDDSR